MAKRDFAFGKENFILIAVAVACIVLGFILMSGGGSGDNTFNPDIFSEGPQEIDPRWNELKKILDNN